MKRSSLSNKDTDVEMPKLPSGGNGESKRNSGFGRPLLWILVAAAVLALISGLMIYRYYSVRESTDDAQLDGHINQIAARVGGTVVAVKVEDNQAVKKGDLLVQLDVRDCEVALARAEADLAEAEAQAKAALTQVPITHVTAGNQISASQAVLLQAQSGAAAAAGDLATARARLTLAQARSRESGAVHAKSVQDLGRLKQLIAKDEISQQEYDSAVTAEETARAAQDSAHAAEAEAQKAIESAQARLARANQAIPEAQAAVNTARMAPQQTSVMRDRASSAQARVQVAKANRDQARLNLEYATVRAPVDGIVSMKTVEVGQVVQPGQPLLAVVPMNDIWVKANFKESQMKDMRPGQRAEISVDAFGGRTFRGHVDSIAAATGARFSLLPPENATGNYVKVVQRIPVKIVLEEGQDPERLLRPGMSVVPTVITK